MVLKSATSVRMIVLLIDLDLHFFAVPASLSACAGYSECDICNQQWLEMVVCDTLLLLVVSELPRLPGISQLTIPVIIMNGREPFVRNRLTSVRTILMCGQRLGLDEGRSA